MIPASPYKYLIYKDGSNYKSDKHNTDGSITNLSSNTDAITVVNAVKTDVGLAEARIHFRDATYDLASSITSTTGSQGRLHWSGESQHGTILKPTGNFPAIVLNNYNNRFENFKISVDQGAGYTVPAFKLLAQNGQSISYADLYHIFIEHKISSTLQQYGQGLGVYLAGTGTSAWSWITAENVRIDGFHEAVALDSSASSGSSSWSNENSFSRIKASGNYNFFTSNMIATHISDNWYWARCGWQTTAVDGTTGDMFNLDDLAQRHYSWSMSQCTGWDFPNTNKKFVKIKSYTYVSLFGCTPDGELNIGGSGYKTANAYVSRAGSMYGPRRGVAKFSADGKTKDFGVAPSLYGTGGSADVRDYIVTVTPASVDAIGEYAIKEDPSASTFVIRYKRPPKAANPPGTQNIVINWEINGWS